MRPRTLISGSCFAFFGQQIFFLDKNGKDEGRKKNDSRKKKDYPFSLESWNSPGLGKLTSRISAPPH